MQETVHSVTYLIVTAEITAHVGVSKAYVVNCKMSLYAQ